MIEKTESEVLFETFCERHSLNWDPVGIESNRTPDYRLLFENLPIFVEIKQIQSDVDFSHGCVTSRKVGRHVRRKILEARKQLQATSRAGHPTILLIYNAMDPMQLFGTEDHDFISAMYGDLTVRLVDGLVEDLFHGRNSTMRKHMNTSFSAVGHLSRYGNEIGVRVFANAFARHPLPYKGMPRCIDVVRIEAVKDISHS